MWILLETDAHPLNDLLRHGPNNICIRIRAKEGEDVDARMSVVATERRYVADVLLEDTPLGKLLEAARDDWLADVPDKWQNSTIGDLFEALQAGDLEGQLTVNLDEFLADLAKLAEEDNAEAALTGKLFEEQPHSVTIDAAAAERITQNIEAIQQRAAHDRDLNAAVNLANLASKPDERLNGRGGHVSPDAGQRPVKRPRAKTNARGPEQSGQPRTTGGV